MCECPHAALPTFDINEGALDKLLAIYKTLLPSMGGYLTHAGTLDRPRLQQLLGKLAEMESSVLEERAAVSLSLTLWPRTYAFANAWQRI